MLTKGVCLPPGTLAFSKYNSDVAFVKAIGSGWYSVRTFQEIELWLRDQLNELDFDFLEEELCAVYCGYETNETNE